MRSLLLVGVTGCLCFGQSVSIGAVGGIRLTEDIRSGQIDESIPNRISAAGATTSESKRYVVGPAIELGLPLDLALEFDALYRHEGYRSRFDVSISPLFNPIGPFGGIQFDRERANSWEFPLLLKYKMRLPMIKPYVEAGYAHRIINGSIDDYLLLFRAPPEFGGASFREYSSTNWRGSHGVVGGLGVQFAFGRWVFSPEARYTRWNNAAVREFDLGRALLSGGGLQGGLPGFESARNQVDLQIGLRWKVH
jgi:hypothetical protein